MKKKKCIFPVFVLIGSLLFADVLYGQERCSGSHTTAVKRDAHGVWFIEARTVYAGFEAMGYCVAEDRLWQLEMLRRAGTGRLAEIFGADQLPVDIFVRTTGYSQAELLGGYSRLGNTEQVMIRAYVDGINRRVGEVTQNIALLPFEFHAMGSVPGSPLKPGLWTITDIMALAVSVMRQFDAEAFATGQLDNAVLLQQLALHYPGDYAAMFNDLRWFEDPLSLVMTGGGRSPHRTKGAGKIHYDAGRAGRGSTGNIIDSVRKKLKKINACVKMGSYAAVLSGKKTAGGNPVLYNGPQMGFQAPSVICEGSIRVPGYTASGMCVPGLPGILVGRTPDYTWSMQVGNGHTTDYYTERPENVYFHRMEIIRIAGAPDIQLPVFRTKHGPVISPMPYDPNAQADSIISWKYAHWQYELEFQKSVFLLGAGNSVGHFAKAVESLPVSMHICYADKRGNIAYWLSGRDPVRAAGADPRFPQAGDGTQEWPEPAVLKPRPFGINPREGYFAGWNGKAAPGYEQNMNYLPELIQGVFQRSHVVKEYFSTKKRYTFADVKNFACYAASTDSFGLGGNPWKYVRVLFTAAVNRYPSVQRLAAVDLLSKWNGFAYQGGPAAIESAVLRADGWVLQDAWITEVLRLIFADEFAGMNMDWTDQPLTVFFNMLLHMVMHDPAGLSVQYPGWLQDKSDSGNPANLEQLIILALDNTLTKLGPVPWNVPRGVISYKHPLLGVLAVTPFAVRSTYSQCVEMGKRGPVRIESMFPLGQSGNILTDFTVGGPLFDKNYFSMQENFNSFTLLPFPLFKSRH